MSRPASSKSRPSRSSGPGRAEAHVAPHVRERGEQRARLGRERQVAAAACAVEPPDLAAGMLRRQGVEHRQDRRRADAGADQQHGRAGLGEDEGASRRPDLEPVSDRDPGVQVAAGGALLLALDGEPVAARAGPSRKGVVAQHRPLLIVGPKSQREVLAGARGRERLAVGILEADGDHRVALALDRRDRQPAEPCPGRRRARRDQARVASAPALARAARLNDACQPGLRAGMRSARSSCWRGCPGR